MDRLHRFRELLHSVFSMPYLPGWVQLIYSHGRLAHELAGLLATFHAIRNQANRPSDKQCAAKDGDGISGQADSLFVDIHADVSAALGRLEAEQSAASEVWLPERCQCAVCGPGDRIFGDSAGWGEEA